MGATCAAVQHGHLSGRCAWSSVHANLGLREDPALTPHPAFLRLGPDATMRGDAYRRWLDEPLLPEDVQAIRLTCSRNALGDPRFQAMVEKALNRPARLRAPGRPRSSVAAESA